MRLRRNRTGAAELFWRGSCLPCCATVSPMHRLSRLPVRTAVIGSALLVVSLVWIFVVVQIRYERHEAIAAAIRENVNRAIALEQYVTRTLERADLASAFVAERYAALLPPGAKLPPGVGRIDHRALRSKGLREINVVNATGELVATSVDTVQRRTSVADAPIFRWHRSHAGTALRVNPPSPSRFLTETLIVLSRRINDSDGRFAGVIGVQVRPSELTNFLHDATLSDTDVVSVIGLDGVTRARRTGDTESFGQNVRGTMVMRMQQRNPNGTYLGPSVLDGRVRYFSHRRLPDYQLFVTSGMAQAAVLRPIDARARGYLVAAVLITAATLLAALLVLTLVKRRVRREAEIVAANDRLLEAQRLARLGEWRFDVAQERFRWCDHLCAMYERPSARGDVTVAEFGALVGEHGMATFRSILKQLQASGERQEYELAARLPSGTISHRRLVAVPNFDAAGHLVQVHGTDQDVTPRKLLESLQHQVSHLSRIDALNAIAATLAHELNQPLAAASNYLSGGIRMLSPADGMDRAVVAEALDDVRAEIHRAGEIIRRVRNLVSNRQARVEPVPLGAAIRNAVAHADAADPGVASAISQRVHDGDTRVLADPIQLQQVLVNLIRNASEACGSDDPRIVLQTCCADPDAVEVSVTDNGRGIINDGRDVFSAFATTKADGLGVGLAICRTLVEAMGGRIWIPERGANGTTLRFTLPKSSTNPTHLSDID